MNFPARQGIATDNTPRGPHHEPFTLTNCEGYDIREIHTLNDEFNDRIYEGEWCDIDVPQAIKSFQSEVNGRQNSIDWAQQHTREGERP